MELPDEAADPHDDTEPSDRLRGGKYDCAGSEVLPAVGFHAILCVGLRGTGAMGRGGGGEDGRACRLEVSIERDREGALRISVIEGWRVGAGGGVGAGRHGMNSLAMLSGRGRSSRGLDRLPTDRERGAGLAGNPMRTFGRLGSAMVYTSG